MKNLLLLLLLLCCNLLHAQQVSTLAGSAGISGYVDASAAAARFNEPHAIAVNKVGDIYVADRKNHRIRKVSAGGVVSTFAGSGAIGGTDGPALTATFNEPWGIACDTLGNVYVVDTKNYKIRKIDNAGMVTTVAGTGVFGTTNGNVTFASFGFPVGITVTPNGYTIYVSDYNTHVIRKIENGQVSTIAGTVFISGMNNGAGATATFNHPYGLSMANNGDVLIADEWNSMLRRMTPSGNVSTIAGTGIPGVIDGSALSAQFKFPSSISSDGFGNIYVADVLSHTIRKLSTAGTVSTYAGAAGISGSANGSASVSRFNNPTSVSYSPEAQTLYVGDNMNHTIRKIVNISSTVLNISLVGSSTRCYGDSITFQITPSNLSNYSIMENTTLLGTSTTSTIKVFNLSPGTHVLFASALDAGGATAVSANISVTVLPPFIPNISSSGSNAICNGAALTLTAQSGTNYLWSTGAITSAITVTTAGNYLVTVTNSSGCKGTSLPFNVTVQNTPIANITAAADSICPSQTTTLTASVANSWLWSNGSTTQSISAVPGNYTVTVTGAGGCTAVSSITSIGAYSVNIPVISPSGTVIVFQGDSALLQASGSSSYVWSNGKTGNGIYASITGTYTVVGTSTNGCTATSIAVNVNVISSATIVTTQGPTSFCDGSSVQLVSVFPAGNQWYYNGMPLAGENDQQFSAYDDGWYYVGVWQNNDWMFSDSIRITVFPTPDVPNVNDTSVCKGSPITLMMPIVSGVTYKWYDTLTGGSLLSSSLNYTTPKIFITTTYYIEAVNTYNCKSDRLDLDVIAKNVPVASFTYNSTVSNGQYDLNFNCTTNNPDFFHWIFGDTTIPGNVSYLQNPMFTYPVAGSYDVMLIVGNGLGCTDTIIKKVVAGANNPAFVPTTFTPNGDGKNDIFRVRGEQFHLKEMRIYDQWGTLIYSTDASNPQWDGSVNGKTVMNGTYVYRIVVVDDNNTSKEMTGPVTVIK